MATVVSVGVAMVVSDRLTARRRGKGAVPLLSAAVLSGVAALATALAVTG